MKRQTILLALAFILSINLSGQSIIDEINLQWSQAQSTTRTRDVIKIVESDDGNIFVLEMDNEKGTGIEQYYFLSLYTKDFKLIKQTPINLKEKGRKRVLVSIEIMNDELYIFSSYRNKKQLTEKLFVQKVIKEDLSLALEVNPILEFPVEKKSHYSVGEYAFVKSNDKSKLLIAYKSYKNEGHAYDYGIGVFTKSIKKLWETGTTDEGTIMNVDDFQVTNSGDGYCIGRVKKEGTDNWNVVEYSNENLNTYLIEAYEGKEDLTLVIDEEENVICTGLISTSKTGLVGSYVMKINSTTKKVEYEKVNKIKAEFITENLNRYDDRSIEMLQYELKHLRINANGDLYILGEQEVSRSMTDGTNTSTSYKLNDILVIKFSSDGTLKWNKRVLKRQKTNDHRLQAVSFAFATHKDELYLIFNDHEENLKLAPGDKIETQDGGRTTVVSVVKLEDNGIQSREMLYEPSQKKAILYSKGDLHRVGNHYTLYGKNSLGSDGRFVNLSFY